MKTSIFFSFFIFLGFTQNVQDALKSYKNRNYAKAEKTFAKLINSPEKQLAYTMLMMSQYAQKKYKKVGKTFSTFLQEKPSNQYLDDIRYIQGKVFFHLKKYKRAIRLWLLSFETTKDKFLLKKLYNLINQYFTNISTLDEIKFYQSTYLGERVQAVIALKIADIEEKRLRFHHAYSALKNFNRKFPNSLYKATISKKLEALEEKISSRSYIGVLLPFKDYPEISKKIYKGIQFALSEKKGSHDIQLKFEDCGSSVFSAIQAFRRLAEDPFVLSVIGPLNSDQAAVTALLSKEYSIPVLNPTATESGLASLSEYFYQLSPDNKTIGKLIAEYAFRVLQKRSFALLTSQMGGSYQIGLGFVGAIERLGGEIVRHEYYDDGAINFSGQFTAIHKAGIKKMFRDSLEENDITITEKSIDSLYKISLEEARNLELKTGIDVDSSKIQVNSIDAFFIPIGLDESDDLISYIVRYYATNNFKTNILGTEKWYNKRLFENRNLARACDSLYVFTPFYVNDLTIDTRNFINAYRVEQKSTPEKFDYLGYRTMSFILSGIRLESRISRRTLQEELSDTEEFELIGGPIRFGRGAHLNVGTRVLQLRYGAFFELDKN